MKYETVLEIDLKKLKKFNISVFIVLDKQLLLKKVQKVL